MTRTRSGFAVDAEREDWTRSYAVLAQDVVELVDATQHGASAYGRVCVAHSSPLQTVS